MKYIHNILAFLEDKGVNRSFLALLLAGLLLRLILAPFTSYPTDMSGFIAKCEWAYIFDFNPLYWEQTGVFRVAGILSFYPVHIIADWLGFGSILTLQLAIKIPYILADIGIAILLHRIVLSKTQNPRMAILVACAWLFNPFTIFVSSVHGIDTLPVFFVLLAAFLLLKNRYTYSFTCLGIAAGLKYFAFFLFPIFLIYAWRGMSNKQRVFSLIGTTVALGINFLPILINPIFRSQLINGFFFYSTGVEQLTIKQWAVWGWLQEISFLNHFPQFIQTHLFWITFIPLYVLVIVLAYRSSSKMANKASFPTSLHSTTSTIDHLSFFKYMAIVLLLFPPLNPHASPQHLLWGLPFLIYLAYIADKRLMILVYAVCALNLISIFTHPWSSPYIYLKNIYPAVVDIYTWPDMSYFSIRLGFLYSLSMLVAIWAVFMLKPNSGGMGSTTHPFSFQDLICKHWGSILTYVIVLVFVFGTLGELPPQPLPAHSADRDYSYREVFSFESKEAIIITSDGEQYKEFKYQVDAVPFMTDRTWEDVRAYVEFDNLPYGADIIVNEQSLPYSAVAKRNIPYSAQIVDFIEIPNPKANLLEKSVIRVGIPQSQVGFKGVSNGNFERGLTGWTSWTPEETGIDDETGTISNLGGKSLVTRRTATSDWVFVFQYLEVKENTKYRVEAWMRIQNAKQASFKITYHNEKGESIGNIQDFIQPLIDGTRDWWRIRSQITTPPGTVSIKVWCSGGSSLNGIEPGVTWFDGVDISLIPFPVEELKATIFLNFDIDE